MTEIKNKLSDRAREIEVYIRLVAHIETALSRRTSAKKRVGAIPDPECFKTMKASVFLMVYNVVEAVIVGSFEQLYANMRSNPVAAIDLIDPMRKAWIDQAFQVPPHTANYGTYRERTGKLVDSVALKQAVNFDIELISVSGNLDSSEARKLCHAHGIKLAPHRAARGGAMLDTVKGKRNALAHGDISFNECGRDYTADQLGKIAHECFVYLRGYVRSVEKFINVRGYAKT